MTENNATLLVVDDDEMNRDLLSRRLSRLGYNVVSASNGKQALDLIRKQPFDLVLLDVMMPGIDGLEVLTTIREQFSIVELPVIMVTARDQSGDVVAALQLGASDYVTKPINFPVVFARIQTHLAIKHSHAQTTKVAAQATSNSTARSDPGMMAASDPGRRRGSSETGTAIDFPTVTDKPTIAEYEILGDLGRGGMGVVYKARHLRMNRMVALKVIDKEYLKHPDAVKRFYQEIQAAAQLSHPNVVIAYDAGQAGETHYFAMEYVEGTDLAKVVAQSGPLAVDQACDYIRQAALGLQHAHDRKLVHRDIKPSNLLMQRSKGEQGNAGARYGLIKILDMGLALLHEPTQPGVAAPGLTREGRVVGTVDYMAPEQWMNPHKVDIRADLYSLGCTFYFLLTGQVPFPGDEAMEKMLKHHLDQPKPLESLRSEVPPKVCAVVRRLMAKKPEERYRTPGELAELLKWFQPTS